MSKTIDDLNNPNPTPHQEIINELEAQMGAAALEEEVKKNLKAVEILVRMLPLSGMARAKILALMTMKEILHFKMSDEEQVASFDIIADYMRKHLINAQERRRA